ncbi:conserved domain protein [synthetic Mycoplasma mycoides JCVI-syn1.0]|nr:conserved domain protein [synthetic Mycoplasma mycoides JCVI-syn1.0]
MPLLSCDIIVLLDMISKLIESRGSLIVNTDILVLPLNKFPEHCDTDILVLPLNILHLTSLIVHSRNTHTTVFIANYRLTLPIVRRALTS